MGNCLLGSGPLLNRVLALVLKSILAVMSSIFSDGETEALEKLHNLLLANRQKKFGESFSKDPKI